MKIKRALYHKLIEECPAFPPESGGVLGGVNGTVLFCEFDSGIGGYASYTPDILHLNGVIYKWSKIGIELYGLFHTHPQRATELSPSDKEYIADIMNIIYGNRDSLYFPIVFPRTGMTVFKAIHQSGKSVIMRTHVDIIP